MNEATSQRYHTLDMPLPNHPLQAVRQLVSSTVFGSGPSSQYVVYERNGRWSVAAGVAAEVTLDKHGARLRRPVRHVLPWDGPPLHLVRRLLAEIPIDEWRAYGWATFELSYAKDGDRDLAGDDRLLHLVVPRTEIHLEPGRAVLRSLDEGELSAVAELLQSAPVTPIAPVTAVDVRRDGAQEYRHAVDHAVGQIRAGDLQKVILSRRVPLEQDIDLVSTYVRGRRGNNPARSFLLRVGGVEAAGFSPEIVVRVEADGRVVSQPLAGTRALTADPVRNGQLRRELLADPKEVFEHAISVRVACDDLEDVCTPGSITVEEFMAVRERGSVQHLASQVAGQLAEGRDHWDAFAATFPAVTASGVPKEAAYASIRAHEPGSRGLYSGAVLTVDQTGELDAALVLRAIYRRGSQTWLQAGAGIVGQSRSAREFEETCEKLDSVAQFLVPSAGGPWAPLPAARAAQQPPVSA